MLALISTSFSLFWTRKSSFFVIKSFYTMMKRRGKRGSHKATEKKVQFDVFILCLIREIYRVSPAATKYVKSHSKVEVFFSSVFVVFREWRKVFSPIFVDPSHVIFVVYIHTLTRLPLLNSLNQEIDFTRFSCFKSRERF